AIPFDLVQSYWHKANSRITHGYGILLLEAAEIVSRLTNEIRCVCVCVCVCVCMCVCVCVCEDRVGVRMFKILTDGEGRRGSCHEVLWHSVLERDFRGLDNN